MRKGKRSLCLLLALLMCLSLLPMGALAEEDLGAGEVPVLDGENEKTYAVNVWLEGAKARAEEADHVLYPNMPSGVIVIEPGETVSVYPAADHPGFGIQGGYISSWWGNSVWQLDDPQVNTDWLVRSDLPAEPCLTPIAQEVMPIYSGYADRMVDRPDDPVAKHYETGDGLSYLRYDDSGRPTVPYNSLYRNDTGLPILLCIRGGGNGISFGTTATMDCVGTTDSDKTNFQGGFTVYDQPVMYFADPWYEVTVVRAEIMAGGVDMENVVWPAELTDGVYTTKLYVDNDDHTYTYLCPRTANGCFERYYNDGGLGSLFTLQDGERDGDTYSYAFNLPAAASKTDWNGLNAAMRDQELKAHFGRGDTVRFDAQGGTIGDEAVLLAEVCEKDNGFNDKMDLRDYVPVREGYVFQGWCTDPEKPEETLITDTDPADNLTVWHRSQHTDLYAVWMRSVSDAKIKLSPGAFTYDGEAKTPEVTVRLDGKVLTKDEDYTVKFGKNKNAGTATVRVTGEGNYTGSATKNFTIKKAANKITVSTTKIYASYSAKKAQKFDLGASATAGALTYTSSDPSVKVKKGVVTLPKGFNGTVTITISGKATKNYKAPKDKTVTLTVLDTPTLTSVTSDTAKKLTATWSKVAGASGYELQYTKAKKFATASDTVTLRKTAKTLSKLTAGKTYRVRVRAYKTLKSGETFYSAWSEVGSVKVK